MTASDRLRASPEPELVFTDREVPDLLDQYGGPDAVIVTDSHNAPALRRFSNVHLVTTAEHRSVDAIRSAVGLSDAVVIGVGGCSALDVARYIATPRGRVVMMPSILSTSCVSVNRSVLYRNGLRQSVKTLTPESVVVSLPSILAGDPAIVWKWSQSGFGDVFANISATIDVLWRRQMLVDGAPLSGRSVWEMAPSATAALEWVLSTFRAFDEEAIAQLARFIHESSMEVLHADSVELSAAGEHDLYYTLMCDHGYPHDQPTHGQIVAVGTVLSAHAHARLTGDTTIAAAVTEACRRLRLPLSYAELDAIGLRREHLLEGLHAIRARTTFLAWSFRTWGATFVDSVLDGRL